MAGCLHCCVLHCRPVAGGDLQGMATDEEQEEEARAATRIGSMYRGKKSREKHRHRLARGTSTAARHGSRVAAEGVHRRREATRSVPPSIQQLPSMKGQIIDRAERVLSELQLADEVARKEHVCGLRGARALIFLTQLR